MDVQSITKQFTALTNIIKEKAFDGKPYPDPNGLNNRDPKFIEQIAQYWEPMQREYFHADVSGIENIPEGPILYVGNHNGGMMPLDGFVAFYEVLKTCGIDYVPHGLGHELIFFMPGIGRIIPALGGVKASPENARRLLDSGHKVLVYPGGDVDSFKPTRDRAKITFAGRKGFIKLAIEMGVSIVPLVSLGGHETFRVLASSERIPKMLGLDRFFRLKILSLQFALPWGLTFLPMMYFPLPTKIYCRFLKPINPVAEGFGIENEALDAAYQTVHTRMQEALDQLAVLEKQEKHQSQAADQ